MGGHGLHKIKIKTDICPTDLIIRNIKRMGQVLCHISVKNRIVEGPLVPRDSWARAKVAHMVDLDLPKATFKIVKLLSN